MSLVRGTGRGLTEHMFYDRMRERAEQEGDKTLGNRRVGLRSRLHRNEGRFRKGQASPREYDVRVYGPRIIEGIKAGNYFKVACQAAGVSDTTAYRWLRLGEGLPAGRGYSDERMGKEEYVEFARQVREAEAHLEGVVVKHWLDEIPGNWLAARDFLARRFRGRWGQSGPGVTASIEGEGGVTQLKLTWEEGPSEDEGEGEG
jgi:hypothetical protein